MIKIHLIYFVVFLGFFFSRKTGNSSRPNSATGAVPAASAYIYPDISTFPELKGDDATLYVDLVGGSLYSH